MLTSCFDLAGFKVCVKAKQKFILDLISKNFKELPSHGRHSFNFTVFAEISYDGWENIAQNNPVIKNVKNMYEFNIRTTKGKINWRDKTGFLKMAPDLNSLQLSIENFFRPLYAIYLFETDGILLHASGSIYKNRAFIFCGHSGSGKSTIANLLKKRTDILSDDIIAIRLIRNEWFAQASPFRVWNAHLKNKKYPIAALFRLKKATPFSVKPLNFSHTINLLMSSAPFLPDSKHKCLKILDKAENFGKRVPSYELKFSKHAIPFKHFISNIE